MLVLTRKPNQQLHIGNDIVITVVKVRGNTIRLGIEAPRDVRIVRSELDAKPEVDSTDKSDVIVAEIALATECEAAADATDEPGAQATSALDSQSSGAKAMGQSPAATSTSVTGKRTPLKPFTNRKPSQASRAGRNVDDGPMCHCPGQTARPVMAKEKLVRGPLRQGDSLRERALLSKGRVHNLSVVARS